MISINGIGFTPTVFPDGTSQMWKLPEKALDVLYKEGVCTIKWDFESEAEFIHLAQLKTLLDTYCPVINLDMPYLPYARQDKRIDNNSTFALHTFAKLLNSLNFNQVTVLDAHNNFRANMINGLVDGSPKRHISYAQQTLDVDLLLFPDAGAKLRYEAYSLEMCWPKSVYADKVREQATGLIKGITIVGKVKGKKLLIVDDICDGGMTFILVAKEALAQGAKEVHLYVTHGIFSKGLAPLLESGIKRIFTHKGEVNPVTSTEYSLHAH